MVAGSAACSNQSSVTPAPGNGDVAPSAAGRVTYPLLATAVVRALPSIGGYSGTLALARVTAPAGATLTLTAATPMSPAVASVKPLAEGRITVYYLVTFTASATVTFPAIPAFSVTLPPSLPVAGRSFYHAISDPAAATLTFRTEGPAGVNGHTLTFAAGNEPLTLTAGKSYTFAFYATQSIGTPAPASPAPTASPKPTPIASPEPTPTASPKPKPTPTSAPVVVVSPAVLDTTCSASACRNTSLSVSEANYTGGFDVTSCTSYVMGPSNAVNCTPTPPGIGQEANCSYPPTPSALYVVSNANGTSFELYPAFVSAAGGSGGGSYVCKLTISDDKGRSGAASITFNLTD